MQSIRLLLTIVLAGAFAHRVSADDWKIIPAAGRDYVSFANVAQFYGLPQYTRVSRTVSLRGDRRAIRAQAGTSYNNAVNFQSSGPTIVAASTNLPPHARSITESLGNAPRTRINPVQKPSAVIQAPN